MRPVRKRSITCISDVSGAADAVYKTFYADFQLFDNLSDDSLEQGRKWSRELRPSTDSP